MIDGARQLPARHVTMRVPWHDKGWADHVCKTPSANTYCSVLRGIAAAKIEKEDDIAGAALADLPTERFPPCVDERGTFMAKRDIVLVKSHPYKQTSPDTHGHYAPTRLRILARSAACVPFAWMLRQSAEDKIAALQIGFDEEKEPKLSFETSWFQATTKA